MALTIDSEKLENCAQCTCFNLRKASRVISQLFDRKIRPAGLRGTQFSILAVLSAHGPETITRLSEIMAMDRTTLTRNLRPMERAGTIKITHGGDLRTKSVSLTATGRRTFATTFHLWEKTQNQIIEKLGKTRFHSLIKDLSEVTEIFSVKERGG